MKFNTILKELRKNANLTQEQLSIKLGCSAGAIGLYEQGRRKPDDETLVSLAKIFDVSVDYLLGLECNNYKINTEDFSELEFAMLDGFKKLDKKTKLNVINIINDINNKK